MWSDDGVCKGLGDAEHVKQEEIRCQMVFVTKEEIYLGT